MPGIKLLDKTQVITIQYILNELLKPDIHQLLFDDYYGYGEIGLLLMDPRTVVYGVFEQGRPEPVGVVFFVGMIPYRDCILYSAVFDPDKRRQGKMTAAPEGKLSVAERIKQDMIQRYHIHSCSAQAIEGNEASVHILEKLGFKKIGTKEKCVFTGGQYKDVHQYYLLLGETAT